MASAFVLFAVGDDDLACADDFELIAFHDDSGGFVNAYAEQFGVSGDDFGKVFFAAASVDVLVYGYAAQKAEADFVAFGHHDRVAFARSTNQIRSLNAGARR